MNEWHILPQPERVTELYFTQYQQQPLKAGIPQAITFTVRNSEHRSTAYHYMVLAASADNGATQVLNGGAFTLRQGTSLTRSDIVTVPRLSAHTMVKVDLQYEGILLGNKKLEPETQSIHWNVSVADSKDGHAAS